MIILISKKTRISGGWMEVKHTFEAAYSVTFYDIQRLRWRGGD